jgi:hypothetical protein
VTRHVSSWSEGNPRIIAAKRVEFGARYYVDDFSFVGIFYLLLTEIKINTGILPRMFDVLVFLLQNHLLDCVDLCIRWA